MKMVVEAMKMEFTVAATAAGRVVRVLCAAGQGVAPGQALVLLSAEAAEAADGPGRQEDDKAEG